MPDLPQKVLSASFHVRGTKLYGRTFFLFLFRSHSETGLNGRRRVRRLITVRQPQMQVLVDNPHDFDELFRLPATQSGHFPYQLETIPRIFIIPEVLHLIYGVLLVIIDIARGFRVLV